MLVWRSCYSHMKKEAWLLTSNSDDGTCIDRKSSACDCYLSLATLLPPAILMQRDAESHRCKIDNVYFP